MEKQQTKVKPPKNIKIESFWLINDSDYIVIEVKGFRCKFYKDSLFGPTDSVIYFGEDGSMMHTRYRDKIFDSPDDAHERLIAYKKEWKDNYTKWANEYQKKADKIKI